MTFSLDQVISTFTSSAQGIFDFYRSVNFLFGAQNVSMFDIFIFFMIVSVIWYFLTGSGGDDD